MLKVGLLNYTGAQTNSLEFATDLSVNLAESVKNFSDKLNIKGLHEIINKPHFKHSVWNDIKPILKKY